MFLIIKWYLFRLCCCLIMTQLWVSNTPVNLGQMKCLSGNMSCTSYQGACFSVIGSTVFLLGEQKKKNKRGNKREKKRGGKKRGKNKEERE